MKQACCQKYKIATQPLITGAVLGVFVAVFPLSSQLNINQNVLTSLVTVEYLLVTAKVTLFFLRPTDAALCDVSLPQDTSMLSKCYLIREIELKRKQKTFNLAPGTQDLPFALLDMKPIQLMKIIELDPFIRYYANKWLTMGGVGNLITKQYLKRFPNEIKNITQYEQISRFFQAAFQTTLGVNIFFLFPGVYVKSLIHVKNHVLIS